MSDDARIQRVLADICLRAEAGEGLARSPRAFLERQGLAPEDLEPMVAGAPRLALYRELVQEGLQKVVRAMLPRTIAWLTCFRPDEPQVAFAEFLDAAPPRTPYYRDVPAEFLAWAAPRWAARDDLPPWLPDLARHELIAFTVAAAPSVPIGETLVDVALDRTLVFAEAKQIARYAYAVHALPDPLGPDDAPEERDTALLVHRDAQHEVRYLDLSPLAAAILEQLFEGTPLGPAIAQACARAGVPADDAVLAGTARLLADLGERGVLLGARPLPA